jgi:dTDP-4-amino-4,6-dideoxygalactose transaminase
MLRRPVVPADCQHNAHMYYVLLAADIDRQAVLDALKSEGIGSVFHYVPLHSSPGGMRYGRVDGNVDITNDLSERLIRLPLWVGLTESQQNKVVCVLKDAIGKAKNK